MPWPPHPPPWAPSVRGLLCLMASPPGAESRGQRGGCCWTVSLWPVLCLRATSACAGGPLIETSLRALPKATPPPAPRPCLPAPGPKSADSFIVRPGCPAGAEGVVQIDLGDSDLPRQRAAE